MSARSQDIFTWTDKNARSEVHAQGPIHRILHAVLAWYKRRQVTAELMALDEHMLADIGVTRADIPSIANETYLPQNWSPRGYQPAFVRVAANTSLPRSGAA